MLPSVLIVGQSLSTLPWIEDCASGFRSAGAQASSFNTRGNGLWQKVRYRLLKKIEPASAQRDAVDTFAKVLAVLKPQLVLFIAPFHQTEFIFAAKNLSNAIVAGWVGDRFSQDDATAAALCDKLFFTDSGFLSLAKDLNFVTASRWLPLATQARQSPPGSRVLRGIFVGNPTRDRKALLAAVNSPVCVHGPGWRASELPQHQIGKKMIAPLKLGECYAKHAWVLNMRNEYNVIHGLNHRSFEPYVQATPVIHDDVKDLPLCFEPGREILVYSNAEELNDLAHRAERSPAWLTEIGANGRKRVLTEHTYERRAQVILSDLFADINPRAKGI